MKFITRFVYTWIYSFILLVIGTSFVAADTAANTLTISIQNNDTTSYNNYPFIVSLNNTQLVTLGYISASGLNTQTSRSTSSTNFPSMVSSMNVSILVDQCLGNRVNTYYYKMGYDPARTTLDVITGNGGYFYVANSSSMLVSMDTSTSGPSLAKSTYDPVIPYRLEGDTLVAENEKVYLECSPAVLQASGWVSFNYTLKNFEGPVDIVFGFGGRDGVSVENSVSEFYTNSQASQWDTLTDSEGSGRVWIEIPFKGFEVVSGEYFIGLKPSGLSVSIAESQESLWLLDPWYSSSWLYRKTVSVYDPVSNYSMKLIVGYNTSAPLSDVYLNSNCNLTSFQDLRFTASDGSTLLDYWIETTNSTSAVVWVENGSPANSTIYMYYGNSAASSVSDGYNTFLFFEHFDNGTTFNLTKWSIFGKNNTTTISNSNLSISLSAVGGGGVVANSALPLGNYSFEGYVFNEGQNDGGYPGYKLGFVNKQMYEPGTYGNWYYFTGVNLYMYVTIHSWRLLTAYNQTEATGNSGSIPTFIGTWVRMTAKTNWVTKATTGTYFYVTSGVTYSLNASGATNGGDIYPILQFGQAGYHPECDWFFVRPLPSTEPTFSFGGEETSTWHNSGWVYRKGLTVLSTTAQTNYQVKLVVGYNSSATGENIDCESHSQTSFGDLRFNTTTGTNCDYWVESTGADGPSYNATVWVEVPSLSIGNNTVYMYYGNSAASSASNGTNTFLFFDDFERGSDGDAVGGAWNITTGAPKISTTNSWGGTRSLLCNLTISAYEFNITLVPASNSYAINYRLFKDSGSQMAVAHGDGTRRVRAFFQPNTYLNYTNSGGTDTTTGYVGLPYNWSYSEFSNLVFSSSTFDWYWNGTKILNDGQMYTNSLYTNRLAFIFARVGTPVNNNTYIDNVIVRKWDTTEPVYSSSLSEESSPGDLPFITTNSATSVGSNSATLNGNLTSGTSCTKRGFAWGSTSVPSNPGNTSISSYSTNYTEEGTFSAGVFSYSTSSFSMGTRYYYRAYAYNTSGWSWGEESSFVTWHLPDWAYRKAFNISSASAESNYQVKFIIGYNSSSTGENIDCESHSQTSFNDLRFNTTSGTNCDYWIESTGADGVSYNATVWVEVPSLSIGNNTIYMYYGNSGASSASNGTNTFILFDDFEGSSVSTSRWLDLGGTSVSGGILSVNSTTTVINGTYSNRTNPLYNFTTGSAFRSRIKTPHFYSSSYLEVIGFRDYSNTFQANAYLSHTLASIAGNYYLQSGSSSQNNITGGSSSNWTLIDVCRNSTSSVIFSLNNANTVHLTTGVPSANMSLALQTYSSGSSLAVDWVLGRKFSYPEPIYSSSLSEEVLNLFDGPTVTTSSASSIGAGTAQFNGELTSGYQVSQRGFAWGTTFNSTLPGNYSPLSSSYPAYYTWSASYHPLGLFNYTNSSLAKGDAYYYRAYAYNISGWSWGSESSFITLPNPPSSFVARSLNSTAVRLDWAVGDGYKNTYIVGKAGSYPSSRTDGYVMYNSTSTTYTNMTIPSGEKYYFSAWSYSDEVGGLIAWSDTYAQASADYPSVGTTDATLVEETTATLNGNITNVGSDTPAWRAFAWGTTSNSTVPGTSETPPTVTYPFSDLASGSYGVGSLSYSGSGLSQGTVYYYRAAANNTAGWGWGNQSSFLTKPEAPNSFIVTRINTTALKLDWIRGTGYTTTYIRGKAWSYPTDRTDGIFVYNGTSNTYTNMSLGAGEDWYYKAWTCTTGGGFMQWSDLYAEASSYSNIPYVTTASATSITEISTTFNGEILSGEDVTTRGFVWGSTSNSTTPGPGTTPPASYTSSYTDTAGFPTFEHPLGTFLYTNNAMSPGSAYYYRAFASNTSGYGYGTEYPFIMLPYVPTGLTASGTSLTSITLNWTKGSGAYTTYIRGKVGSYPANIADGSLVYNDTGIGYVHSGVTPGDTVYYRAWSLAFGGGMSSTSSTYAQVSSSTGPIPTFPTSFDAVGYNLTSISLSWTKDPLATTTYIRGKVGSYPTDLADGALVYNGTLSSYTHTGLTTGDIWYYRAWSWVTESGLSSYSVTYSEDYSTTGPRLPLYWLSWKGYIDTTQTGSIFRKEGYMGLYCPGGGLIAAYEGTNITLTYALASGTHNITMLSNSTLAYTELWVDGSCVSVEGLKGLGNSTNINPWLCESGPARSTSWVIYKVGGVERLRIEPTSLIDDSSTLSDMSGNGNTGYIVWGENPSGTMVSTLGIASTGSYAMGSVTIDPDYTPTIIPVPGTVNLGGDESHTSTPPIIPPGYDPDAPDPMAGVDPITPGGLPVYELVSRAAASLGWTPNTLYAVLMWMTAVAMGAGAFIATGSLFGGGIMLVGTLAVASSTGVIAAWIPILMGLALVFIVVLSRSM